MSYNLAFWSEAAESTLDAADVYKRLNAGQSVDGVAELDREAVVLAFGELLPGWAWDGQFLVPPGVAPDETPAFDVEIGEQSVEFIAYGFTEELANEIILAMRSLGLRLYDPQVDQRFA